MVAGEIAAVAVTIETGRIYGGVMGCRLIGRIVRNVLRDFHREGHGNRAEFVSAAHHHFGQTPVTSFESEVEILELRVGRVDERTVGIEIIVNERLAESCCGLVIDNA